jgi:hypothetical protein
MTTPSDQAKDALLLASGIINAALPTWVSLLPDATEALEAALRIMVAMATLVFLVSRIIYYRKKTKLLTRKNAKEDNDE